MTLSRPRRCCRLPQVCWPLRHLLLCQLLRPGPCLARACQKMALSRPCVPLCCCRWCGRRLCLTQTRPCVLVRGWSVSSCCCAAPAEPADNHQHNSTTRTEQNQHSMLTTDQSPYPGTHATAAGMHQKQYSCSYSSWLSKGQQPTREPEASWGHKTIQFQRRIKTREYLAQLVINAM